MNIRNNQDLIFNSTLLVKPKAEPKKEFIKIIYRDFKIPEKLGYVVFLEVQKPRDYME
jgi:hypothetical protein